jgi:glutaredoxin-like protein NrdH
MKTTKVVGKNGRHKVLLYTISTCAWCKMTKKYLKDNDIAYEYVDVDLTSGENHEKIRDDIVRRGGEPSYPTIIIDDKTLITGFRRDKINEALEI